MFEPCDDPRLFALPPGVDFPSELIRGLRARLKDQPPEAIAGVELIVNTRRMARRIRSIFESGTPSFVPRIKLLTDLSDPAFLADMPAPISPLRRRLEVIQLVEGLISQQPDLAARSAIYDLSDSLVSLMDELRAEGVSPNAIANLDVSDSSGHWQRAQAFLGIVQHFFEDTGVAPDTETLATLALERRIEIWTDTPPKHPVVLAGSTGSRGLTARLMRAVAGLPQGAVVLPGFDFEMPDPIWEALDEGHSGEDHPQFRFARLMADLRTKPVAWTNAEPPSRDRNRLVSLALRPAPVTDQWLRDGPKLPDLLEATADITLIEADGQRKEAMAIAMRLRQAAEEGQTAALITPDRMLTRRVSSALDRWGILPDDSAGTPLQLSPPGRFLRHVSALMHQDLTSDALLTLLKHPLTHSGTERNEHLRLTRDLELEIRDKGEPFPSADFLKAWSLANDAVEWGRWLGEWIKGVRFAREGQLADLVSHHIALSERLAAGPHGDGSGGLWDKAAGREAAALMDRLKSDAPFGGDLTAHDYVGLFNALVSREEVRDRDAPHPNVLIWGTLEARVQGADLVILGGLNEGSWPEMPGADPWLNRKMRMEAGLLLPERRIGLSAHDFQQAIAGREIWLTRSTRSDDAQTVASRWLNRMMNLMDGVATRNGPEALRAMRNRGRYWLDLVELLEQPDSLTPAARPSVVVPAAMRPSRLSVTRIKHLIRDPYAIYAQDILKLRPLMPVHREPDALLRGTVVHAILEKFVRLVQEDPSCLTVVQFRNTSTETLTEQVPWATTRHLWQARLDRVASWFVEGEVERRRLGTPLILEKKGEASLNGVPFTLSATVDRIDIAPDGQALIYDYKTGSAPSTKEQKHFDKQLLLEAAMVENGAFPDLGPARVLRAEFLSLGSNPESVAAPLNETPTKEVWARFRDLISAYLEPDQGFTARRAMQKDGDIGDYDHLSRYGEWDDTDDPQKVFLT